MLTQFTIKRIKENGNVKDKEGEEEEREGKEGKSFPIACTRFY